MDVAELKSAHRASVHNRPSIEASTTCGCFYCRETFPVEAIASWIDAGATPLCPRCGMDAVIGDASGFPVTDVRFLEVMRDYWFGEGE